MYLRQRWKDTRMAYPHWPHHVVLNQEAMSQVWTPDLFFPNEKEAIMHDITVPNRLMRIYPDGTVMYSLR